MPLLRLHGGAAAAAPLLFLCHCTLAASIDVNPVLIDLAPTARSAELRLTNTANEELSVQVDVREWSQDFNGAQQLTDTRDLMAVPPLVTIPPGERQIIRIGHLGAPAPDVERSFRILVTELAPAAQVTQQPGLGMRMRVSIPVFVAPAAAAAEPEIVVEEIRDAPEGARWGVLHNLGNAHAKITQIEIQDGGEWIALPDELVNRVRYLLPDARAQIVIPQEHAALRAIRITSVDGREWEHAVPAPQ